MPRCAPWLLPLLLLGCEQVAELDELHVVHDAGVSASEPDAGEPEDAGPDPYAELRALCVSTINAHRATLSLPALRQASSAQIRCADDGASLDATMSSPHYAARNRTPACKSTGLAAENTCPNWHYGASANDPTPAAALVRCLGRMWAQGMPPIPVADCVKDQEPGGCFAQHGDWINMASAVSKVVACGFAEPSEERVWMNQDFAAR